MGDVNYGDMFDAPDESVIVDGVDGYAIENKEMTQTAILTDEQEQEIIEYLSEEIEYVDQERGEFLERIAKWRRHREARPDHRVKNFPWAGASNIRVPTTMTNTNGIYAMMKSDLSSRVPFWSVQTIDRTKYREEARAIEELLKTMAESPDHMNLRKKNNTILYDLVSLGTEFVKIPWRKEEWNFKRKTADGTLEDVVRRVKNTVDLEPMRIEDFYTRAEWGDDLQRAPWIAHGFDLMKHELKYRGKKGTYENVDKILEAGSDMIDTNREDELDGGGTTPAVGERSNRFRIYECYVYYDVDDDGVEEDLVVWIHPPTRTILRVEHNDLGVRPVVRIPYFERPGELYAMGVGWMNENTQEEVDTLHNMRIDGMLLSMLQIYITRRGSGVGPDQEWSPLTHLQLDDPQGDFNIVKFPDISYGTLQAELMSKEYGDRASAAADAMMGFESRAAGTRATSSGTQFLAQQGSRIFTAISASVEDAYGEIGKIAIYQILRNKMQVLDNIDALVPPDCVEPLKNVLDMNIEDIPLKFKFSVKTTDAEKSEDARRQSILTLFQLYSMGAEKLIQLANMLFNPQMQMPPEVKQAATKFYIGGTKLLEEIMEFFGEEEREDYVPYVKDLQFMIQTIEAMKDNRLQMIKGGMNGQQQGQGPGPQAGGGYPTGQLGGNPAQQGPPQAPQGPPAGPVQGPVQQ